MTKARPDRRFLFLLPAAGGLLALFVRVQLTDEQRFFTDVETPAVDLDAYAELLRPALSHEQLVQRAREVAGALGVETQGLFHAVQPRVDRPALERLHGAHGVPEILAFAARGAPLCVWNVELYEPIAKAKGSVALRVSLDGQGRVTGLDRPAEREHGSYTAWLDERRAEVPRWLGRDPASLEPIDVGGAELMGQRRRWEAQWRVVDLALGDLEARIRVELNRGRERLALFLHRPSDPDSGSSGDGRFSFWGSLLLAVFMAFGIGRSATRGPPASGPRAPARWPLVVGLALAAGVSATQLVLTDRSTRLGPWLLGVFALALASFLVLAVLVARARPDARRPGPWARWFFVAALPASYAVMYLGCSFDPFRGCTDVCSLVRLTVVPLALLSLVAGRDDGRFYAYALLLCAISLVPHCRCANDFNRPWIELVGASPMCYFLGYAAALLSVMGLSGILPRLAALLFLAAGTGGLLVGLGHQLFGFPW